MPPNNRGIHCRVVNFFTGKRKRTSDDAAIMDPGKCRCDYCGYIFDTKNELADHIHWRCFQQKKFKCLYCKFRSSTTDDVNKHIDASHEGRVVPQLPLIDYKAFRIGRYKRKWYLCPIGPCPHIYAYENNLKKHLRWSHDARELKILT